MSTYPPTPFPEKGVTPGRPSGTPCVDLPSPWGGPAETAK